MLSVLFAVTPIWCTCYLDRQRDICDVSWHFVLQVAFSPLSMPLIFLQWSWWPFLQCDVLFTGNELIVSGRIADPNTVTRGEGIRWRLINVKFTISFIIFVIRSRINAIKLCSLSLWATHVRVTYTYHIHQKQNSCMQKLQLGVGHTFLSPFIMKQPYNNVWRAAKQSSVIYIITNRLTLIRLNFIESTLWFLLHIMRI